MSLEVSIFLQLFLYLILRVKELVFGDMYGKSSILLLIPIILIQAITIKSMYIYIANMDNINNSNIFNIIHQIHFTN